MVLQRLIIKTRRCFISIPVTGLIIAYNCDRYIAKTIDNIKHYADKVVVCDNGSTDKTVDISHEKGCEIHHIKWENSFAKLRNNAMSFVDKKWILFIDSDEYLSDKLLSLLPSLVEYGNKNNSGAFYFWRKSIFDGSLVGEEYQPRLIQKSCRWLGSVHEGIECKGQTYQVPKEFEMYHVHTMKEQLHKNKLYQNLKQGISRPGKSEGAEYDPVKKVWNDVVLKDIEI